MPKSFLRASRRSGRGRARLKSRSSVSTLPVPEPPASGCRLQPSRCGAAGLSGSGDCISRGSEHPSRENRGTLPAVRDCLRPGIGSHAPASRARRRGRACGRVFQGPRRAVPKREVGFLFWGRSGRLVRSGALPAVALGPEAALRFGRGRARIRPRKFRVRPPKLPKIFASSKNRGRG